MRTQIFKQGSDNWGYLISNKAGEALAVDPLESQPYLDRLQEKNLTLTGILCTHYHHDHIEGIPGILKAHSVPVVGPDTHEAPKFVTDKILEGAVPLASFSFESYFLPGHSQSHCVYREKNKNWLFVGDLLFNLGCGRVMDCPPEILFDSLQELKDFPIGSEIFVGHDYRKKNLDFCTELNSKFYSALNLSDLGESTSLEMEMWWNPFLKANSFDEWWELRQRRNRF